MIYFWENTKKCGNVIGEIGESESESKSEFEIFLKTNVVSMCKHA